MSMSSLSQIVRSSISVCMCVCTYAYMFWVNLHILTKFMHNFMLNVNSLFNVHIAVSSFNEGWWWFMSQIKTQRERERKVGTNNLCTRFASTICDSTLILCVLKKWVVARWDSSIRPSLCYIQTFWIFFI